MSLRTGIGFVIALIVIGFSPSSHAAIPASERNALLALYTGTNGSAWFNKTGWNGLAGTECNWFGIYCDNTHSHVTVISLDDNNLSGELPALADLVVLNQFYAYRNRLTGSVPTLAGLTNLQYFEIDENNFTGSIPDLAGLSSLVTFSAFKNHLTGQIPALTGLTHLNAFDVADNQLVGPIPDLTGLTNLMIFYVGKNLLTGPVPAAPSPGSPISESSLCPNPLDTTPSAKDAGWDAATGNTPWWATPYTNNLCDDIFTDPFGR